MIDHRERKVSLHTQISKLHHILIAGGKAVKFMPVSADVVAHEPLSD